MRRVLTIGLFVMIAATINTAIGQEKKVADLGLDKLQAEAVKNHPDVKIADAKVRVVELELELVRVQIKNQIALAFVEWETAKMVEAEAKNQKKQAEELLNRKAINREEYGAAVLKLIKIGGERVKAEQILANAVGRPIVADKANLDKLQADAVKAHPDIRVAEAKVQVVNLDLEKARVLIKAKIAAAQADLASAQAGEHEGRIRKVTAEELYQKKAITREELSAAVLTWIQLRGEETSAARKLQNLEGRPSRD